MTRPYNIDTHNGCITLTNPATGGHRTFKVSTQPIDAKFAPGKRIISLLTGADNENSYTGFGFVNPGKISLWRNKQTLQFQQYVDMIERPEHYMARGVQYLFEGRCIRCNRKLTRPDSIELGYGSECAKLL